MNALPELSPCMRQRVRGTFNADNIMLRGNSRQVSARSAAEFADLQSPAARSLDKPTDQRPNDVPPTAKPPVRSLDLLHFVVENGIQCQAAL
jgi:hypothetical protein